VVFAAKVWCDEGFGNPQAGFSWDFCLFRAKSIEPFAVSDDDHAQYLYGATKTSGHNSKGLDTFVHLIFRESNQSPIIRNTDLVQCSSRLLEAR
jgi:hypothetical protein